MEWKDLCRSIRQKNLRRQLLYINSDGVNRASRDALSEYIKAHGERRYREPSNNENTWRDGKTIAACRSKVRGLVEHVATLVDYQ